MVSSAENTPLNDHAAKAAAGDHEAFSAIYAVLNPKLLGYIARRVQAEHIEDTAADVWVKVAKNISLFDPTKAKVQTWVFRITHNTIIDHYRRQSELTGIEPEVMVQNLHKVHSGPKSPAEVMQQKYTNTKLHRVLLKLSPAAREVIELSFLRGFSNAEVAEITEKTEGNVRIIKMRALQQLRKLMKREV